MSAGGVFKIIANDGKVDRMIMATELINNRIKDIMCMRAKQGFADPTPTLVDIERTHILFVNAHFKPFAAIGYEYNKTRVASGSTTFGGSTTFSIPQFGDFFNDMVVNVSLPAASATVGVVPAFPAYIGDVDQATTATSRTSAVANAVTGVYTKYTHQYVNIQGTVLEVGAAASNFVRYAEYPGQRLFKKVKFEVNGNPLDSYDSDAVIFHQKFRVPPGKMVGWKRLVGQEVPVDAFTDLVSIEGQSNYGAAATELVDANGAVAAGSARNAAVTSRKVVTVVHGPQTPKVTQPALDLWIPLLFWFNRDCRLSIPSVSIPYGQRFITVDLDERKNILFTAPGNLFLKLTVEQRTSAAAGQGTAVAVAITDVKRWVTLTPVLASGSVVDNSLNTINTIDLYTNNIFVTPEIHDIYIKRIGFSLIRVHRLQTANFNTSSGDFLCSQLKWPVETIYLGMRPLFNKADANPNQYRDWHRLTAMSDNVIDTSAQSYSDVVIDNTDAGYVAALAAGNLKTSYSQVSAERLTFPSAVETVDTIKVTAHAIVIFDSYKTQFFRDYISYNFGGANINTPEDTGAYMINFCLYPGTYQPSGHINISRSREFYIAYTSAYISGATPCELVIVAIAINFLLISDGSAVLRYST